MIQFAIGSQVALARKIGSSVEPQGVYSVVDCNQVRITLRGADGKYRCFSTQTGKERVGSKYVDTHIVIESVQASEQRQQAVANRDSLRKLWCEAENAAAERDFDRPQAAVKSIDSILHP